MSHPTDRETKEADRPKDEAEGTGNEVQRSVQSSRQEAVRMTQRLPSQCCHNTCSCPGVADSANGHHLNPASYDTLLLFVCCSWVKKIVILESVVIHVRVLYFLCM